MNLTGRQKRRLRALAHDLEPIMRIGNKRVTDAIVNHVDEVLEARELIKIRMLDAEKDEVDEAREELASRTGAAIVQTIGHTLVLYRPKRKKDPVIRLSRR